MVKHMSYIEKCLDLKSPGDRAPLAVSPDGKWVAVTIHGLLSSENSTRSTEPPEGEIFDFASDWMLGSEVLIVECDSGKIVRPFRKFVSSSMPVWQPGGSELAVALQSSSRKFHRIALWTPGQDAPKLFPDAVVYPFIGFCSPVWTPDGKRVVFLQPFRKHETIEFDTSEKAALSARMTLKSPFDFSIAVLDIAAEQTRSFPQLAGTSIKRSSLGMRVSPAGKELAFLGHVECSTNTQNTGMIQRILSILNLDDGKLYTIGSPQEDNWGLGFSWSPDGSRIAWRTKPALGTGQLLIADLKERKMREIKLPGDAGEGHLNGAGTSSSAPPLWTNDSVSFLITGKSSLLRFSSDAVLLEEILLPPEEDFNGLEWLDNSTPNFAAPFREPESGKLLLVRKNRIEQVDLTSKVVTPLVIGDNEITLSTHFRWLERAVYWPSKSLFTIRAGKNRRYELLQTDLNSGKVSRLAVLCEGRGDSPEGVLKKLTWTLADGTQCGGTLLLPPERQAGKLPPVVMDVYGNQRNCSSLTADAMHNNGILDPYILLEHGYAFF